MIKNVAKVEVVFQGEVDFDTPDGAINALMSNGCV